MAACFDGGALCTFSFVSLTQIKTKSGSRGSDALRKVSWPKKVDSPFWPRLPSARAASALFSAFCAACVTACVRAMDRLVHACSDFPWPKTSEA